MTGKLGDMHMAGFHLQIQKLKPPCIMLQHNKQHHLGKEQAFESFHFNDHTQELHPLTQK